MINPAMQNCSAIWVTWFLLALSQLPTVLTSSTTQPTPDPSGYVAFCPCMGRFGNQADQFLGSLSFAKALNRTLLLPPWVEYRTGELRSIQVPFKTYFKVEALEAFHRVLPIETFMEFLAADLWPPANRISFCYRSRNNNGDCAAKQGNPFGPFWDSLGVDFVASETYGPLHYDISNHDVIAQWQERYPPTQYRVLAFTGAPAAFPVQEHNRHLQGYLEFADNIVEEANNFIYYIRENYAGPFVGIHLRNGADWRNACDLIKDAPLLFAGPQCFGYRGEIFNPPLDDRRKMCLPSKQDVVFQVEEAVRKLGARWVFVASDHDHLLPELKFVLQKDNIMVARLPRNRPLVDLAILSRANIFIGNCFSSFSAFVKRHRDIESLPTLFWGLGIEGSRTNESVGRRDEL
ncbi:GDP-fucose protein O-fucosyltransferase 1-like isoform X2 [Varroa jacobsoni]|nr:GDP-fucose protein O-fucosyltransferase 1-like isoform X2 [Varroa jacobsoni]XP_022695304.1 GDP-fucose protein O-fucosyltransferase 1-like isoform X2 [Varroa jacobsoni]XP_022695305.1 GDP-fucose protein O-fucosyltransferase 1-like isoform X2 [Varroa jacobsoni]XP_022695306.1 GDP-fucose protein O-fucosyltransferase 1-like isoform X2 [Varroa jacobsoni]XP_022695307.1 GDP-fucose protein O-fucosyltransferase 1-like isoform X2 [Varroa jacobsoni]